MCLTAGGRGQCQTEEEAKLAFYFPHLDPVFAQPGIPVFGDFVFGEVMFVEPAIETEDENDEWSDTSEFLSVEDQLSFAQEPPGEGDDTDEDPGEERYTSNGQSVSSGEAETDALTPEEGGEGDDVFVEELGQ